MVLRNQVHILHVKPQKGFSAKVTLKSVDNESVEVLIGGVPVLRFKVTDDADDEEDDGKIVFERCDLSGEEMYDGKVALDVIATDGSDLIQEDK